MLKKLLLAGAALFGLFVIAIALLGWWAYVKFTGPIYVPGNLASAAPRLQPPKQDDAGSWTVEPDVELHHFSVGTGRPVLFVHGGPGFPMREPLPWVAALGDAFEIHHYDQRGCGDSTRPFDRFETTGMWPNVMTLEAKLGLGAQVADLERIRRILGQERLTLIGYSFGGFIAAMYAAEFPEHVEKLILVAPANVLVLPAEEEDLFAVARRKLPEARRAEYDAFLEQYLDFGTLFFNDEQELAKRNLQLGRYMVEAMGSPPIPPETAANVGGWMAFAMYLSMGRHHDYTDALTAITAPTLVIHGGRDMVPESSSRRYAELIPGAELVLAPDADHFFVGEQAELVARVREFLTP